MELKKFLFISNNCRIVKQAIKRKTTNKNTRSDRNTGQVVPQFFLRDTLSGSVCIPVKHRA